MAAINDPLKFTDTVLPKGSWILVTGANGYIASHTVDQLLAVGYKVRGSVRSIERAKWMYKVFEPYGKDNFELVEVPEFTGEGAFDEAVKGMVGVIHMASPVDFNPDPHKVVPLAIGGLKSALYSAAANPEITRFVLTSSSAAVYTPHNDVEGSVTADDFNEEAVKDAWAPPPYNKERAFQVYSASKTEAEQAMWTWHREHGKTERPDLILNAVLPNANIGRVLDLEAQGFASTLGMFKVVWDNKIDEQPIGPQYYIHVQDTARVHVAALLLEEVKEERLFAFADVFDANSELAAFRKAAPDHKFEEDRKVNPRHLIKVPNKRAEDLIKKLGRPGWVGFDECVAEMVEAYRQA